MIRVVFPSLLSSLIQSLPVPTFLGDYLLHSPQLIVLVPTILPCAHCGPLAFHR
jgi:hypothetical protein